MMITAILVTYDSAHIIESALNCLYAHPQIAQCIVVDNASKDSTLAVVRSKFPKVNIISNSDNMGFGAACNQGLEQVSSEIALLMNPDAVIDSDGINALLAGFSSYPNAAIIAPAISSREGVDTASFRLPVIYRKKPEDFIRKIEENVYSAPFVSGAIVMWRMEYMRKVGFFDPAFFLFYEDDDIAIRTARAGYDMLLMSGINVQHVPGQSCPLTQEIASLKLRSSTWSYLYITSKYRGRTIARLKAYAMVAKQVLILCWGRSPEFLNRKFKTLLHKREVKSAEAAQLRDERWEIAEKALAEQWELAVQRHEEEAAAEAEARDKKWEATEVDFNRRWEKILQAHEEQVVRVKREFDKIWSVTPVKDEDKQAKKKMHQERWSAAMKELEAQLADSARIHEQEWQEANTRHEEWCADMDKRLQEKWGAMAKEYEQRLASLAETHESEWAMTQKELEKEMSVINRIRDKDRSGMEKKRAGRDILWAALHFLGNPDEFRRHG